MRRFYTAVVALGSLGLTFGGQTALAGSCGYAGNPALCQAPMAPPPMPVCNQMTNVCHSPMMRAPVMSAPIVRAPVIQAPMIMPSPMPMPPRPLDCGQAQQAPQCGTEVVIQHSAPASFDPVRVYTTQPMGYLRGFNVRRAPNVNIMRVHGMGQTAGLPDAPSGFTDGCHPESTQYCQRPVTAPAPVMNTAPPAPIISRPYVPAATVIAPPAPMPAPRPVHTQWKKVSGPTTIQGMPATQVICAQPAPPPVVHTQVVRPVIGVPVPVPTPIGCVSGPAPMPMMNTGYINDMLAGGPNISSRYGSSGH